MRKLKRGKNGVNQLFLLEGNTSNLSWWNSRSFCHILIKLGKHHPFVFFGGVLSSSTLKTSGDSDLVLILEKRDWKQINWRRNLLFGSFGMFYLGCIQYGIYVKMLSRMLCSLTFKYSLHYHLDKIGQKQISIDQFVHHPIS